MLIGNNSFVQICTALKIVTNHSLYLGRGIYILEIFLFN
ncbi:unnamed protein product, partial [Arabidopsis halleri]